MRAGLGNLRENKAAVAACFALVLVLTGLGVWTNDTSERQGDVERLVRVQNTRVVQALCDEPFTTACLTRATNIVKTCRADAECSGLLGESRIVPPATGEKSAFENPKRYEGSNSSRGLSEPRPDRGASKGHPTGKGGGPKGGGTGGGKKNHHGSPSKPPPGASPPTKAAGGGPSEEEAAREVPGHGPEGEGPPGQETKEALVPQVVESVEGVVGCVSKVDLACTEQEVFGPNGLSD